MRWPAAMFFAAACAVGCRSTSSTFDPFLPRRTIPPPGTGAASGTPDAYYSPAPPYGGSAPAYPALPPGTPATGGANGPFGPPAYPQGSPTPAPVNGGFGAVPGPARTSQVPQAGSQTSQFANAGYAVTADQEPSAVYERRKPSSAGTASARIARSTAGASSVGASSAGATPATVDIMDLPPVLASR